MDGIRKKFSNAAVIRGIGYKGPERPSNPVPQRKYSCLEPARND
jgi:hypothetical protein